MNVSQIVERVLGPSCIPRDRDALRRLLESARSTGAVSPREVDRVVAALELGELRLRDALVPRVDLVAVPVDCPLEGAARRMAESGRRRLPVYRDTLDQVEGVLHALDLARALTERGAGSPRAAGDLARSALFLPETMPLPDALEEMRREGAHLVFVVDERGGLSGLATIEDLLEQLVGPIPDEYGDEGRHAIRELNADEAVVGAAVGLHVLERALGLHLPDGQLSSVGGLVYERLGRIPRPGDVVEVPGARIEVLSVEGARLRDLRVRRWPPPPPPAGSAGIDGEGRSEWLRIGGDVVSADDDTAGRLEGVVVDPASGRVTHLVVGRGLLPPRKYLVPADLVERVSDDDVVRLRVTARELDRLPTYDPAAHVAPVGGWRARDTQYAPGQALLSLGGSPAALQRLTSATQASTAPTPDRRSVEISRHTEVVCDDGPVGHVDLVLLNPATGAATHVVVRRALLGFLAARDIVVPLAWARAISPERIELAVGCAELEQLPEYRPNQELLGDVYQALYDDPRFQGVDFFTLHPQVEGGVVTLCGRVRTAALKAAAEEIVRGVTGVLGVDNRLVADDELEQAVAEALEADPRIRAAEIEVRAELGVVELRGRVATAEEREEAARVAHRVSGVQAVANQLAVEPARNGTAERSSKDDEQ